jgi:molybdate transport system substrate-binding protein
MIRQLRLITILSIFCCLQTMAFAEITVFAGSASKPPLEEAAKLYQAESGVEVVLHFGGSGAMLNQLRLSRKADLFIPGSPDFMAKASRINLVDAESEKTIAYLIPAINVPKGNPKNIQGLADLGRPGIRVGIADPAGVCVGLYAVELLEKNEQTANVRPNISGIVESCAKTASLIPLQAVDATLGWREFGSWNPDRIESIILPPEQIARIGYIPAAIAQNANNTAGAANFLNFLTSVRGKSIFNKWGYLTSEKEARAYAPQARIGGDYKLPKEWR